MGIFLLKNRINNGNLKIFTIMQSKYTEFSINKTFWYTDFSTNDNLDNLSLKRIWDFVRISTIL